MFGFPPPVLKAHTSTLVGDKIYVIGGASSSKGGCFGGVATFNIREPASFYSWSRKGTGGWEYWSSCLYCSFERCTDTMRWDQL